MTADPARIEVINMKLSELHAKREQLIKQAHASLESVRLIGDNIWSFERELRQLEQKLRVHHTQDTIC
jgi:hypothetical protein